MARHSEFMDGEMPMAEAEQWRAHLAACEVCARYDRVLRKGLCLLQRQTAVEPDPDFAVHLRYRLAYEEQRTSLGPVTAGAATSVTVAAVLALAAWLPIMMLSRGNAPSTTVTTGEVGRTATEVAWHGGTGIDEPDSHVELQGPNISLNHSHPAVSLIEHGYTPLIVEAPTAPPQYTQVTLTSYNTR